MHAVIEVTGPDDVQLIDLGLDPRHVVNGERITKARLQSGDEIKFGDIRVVVSFLDEEESTRRGARTCRRPPPPCRRPAPAAPRRRSPPPAPRPSRLPAAALHRPDAQLRRGPPAPPPSAPASGGSWPSPPSASAGSWSSPPSRAAPVAPWRRGRGARRHRARSRCRPSSAAWSSTPATCSTPGPRPVRAGPRHARRRHRWPSSSPSASSSPRRRRRRREDRLRGPHGRRQGVQGLPLEAAQPGRRRRRVRRPAASAAPGRTWASSAGTRSTPTTSSAPTQTPTPRWRPSYVPAPPTRWSSGAGRDYVVNVTPRMGGEVIVDGRADPLPQFVQQRGSSFSLPQGGRARIDCR